ncbi:MAG: DUF4290 domain-containing protein [Saprospirales bacterium]|nr:DUF4290 domain-containing protein [Saprospirales bacterium]
MDYNTSRDFLIIPEYGRHVQGMIQHAITIQNPQERQAFVEKVVNLVVQMNAQNKNVEDYREKVWKHIYKIAHFQLDVLPPSGHIPTPEELIKKPERVPYPQKAIHYRHYGFNVQRLVETARAMEDGPKKEEFAFVIASYMKLAYRTWNKEHYVSDDVIISDLEALSEGQLSVREDLVLDQFAQLDTRPKQPHGHHQQRSGGKQKYQGKGGGGGGGGNGSGGGGGFKRNNKRNKRK